MGNIILKATGLSKRFAGVQALTEIDIEIEEGKVTAVIGPNGSGKSTLFNLLAGDLRPTTGVIEYESRDVTKVPQYKRVRSGLVRTFQESSTFPDLTVAENLHIAGESTRRTRDRDEVIDLCSLGGDEDRLAADLPYGKTKLLGIAMSLMTDPSVLLLDEPAAGISIEETAALSSAIRAVHASGKTVALIDHNVGFILPLADKVYALDSGRVLAQGTSAEVQANLDVITSYLGAPR